MSQHDLGTSDILDESFDFDQSRLLSEPSLSSTHLDSPRDGLKDDDLSISELYLAGHAGANEKPFSLLALKEHSPTPTTPITHDNSDRQLETSANIDNSNYFDDNDGDVQNVKRLTMKSREERLSNDIFVLKKLNESFALFNEALSECDSANQRVAAQLEQTNLLLNKYINVLSKSEELSQLIFDERWEGAGADELILERERIEAEEMRREAARREQEQRAALERERLEQEEKERLDREKMEKIAARGSYRGARGSRGLTRPTKSVVSTQAGTSRAQSSSSSNISHSTTSSRRVTPSVGSKPSRTTSISRKS